MPFTKEQLVKEVIRLKEYGYTFMEIAERLQIPESSVRHMYNKNEN
jgi:orotate phosphoribosyltransferase-like protein